MRPLSPSRQPLPVSFSASHIVCPSSVRKMSSPEDYSITYTTVSQRVFNIRELRELIFDCLEPPITPAAVGRYVRVAHEWYNRFIGSVYECLDVDWIFGFEQARATALLDTLASRPHLAAMVGDINISTKLPFHYFRLVLDVCANLTSLSFTVTHSVPLAYCVSPPLPSGAGLSITSLHLELQYCELDGLEALFSSMTSLRKFRLDGAPHMGTVFRLLSAIPPTLQEFHLQPPFDMWGTSQPAAEVWERVFVSLPALTSLRVEGRARDLAAAGFNAPPSLQQLEVSCTFLSDYAALVENFENPAWFSGLSTLPKFTIIGPHDVYGHALRAIMDDVEVTPVITEIAITLNAGLRAMKRRSGMVWDDKAAADLRSLPRAGWELYRSVLFTLGDGPMLETFTDLYGDQFRADGIEAE